MTAIALTGAFSLKMLCPATATDSTAEGLMIARSASRLMTAKMPSAVLDPNSTTSLPPRDGRNTTLG